MKIIITLLLLCIASVSVNAQGFTSLDAVAFARGTDSVQLEAYYSILQKLLPFQQKGSAWTAPINGALEVYQEGKRIARTEIHKEKTFNGSEEDLKKHIADDVLDGAYFAVASKPNTEVRLILENLTTDSKNSFNDTIRRQVDIPVK